MQVSHKIQIKRKNSWIFSQVIDQNKKLNRKLSLVKVTRITIYIFFTKQRVTLKTPATETDTVDSFGEKQTTVVMTVGCRCFRVY